MLPGRLRTGGAQAHGQSGVAEEAGPRGLEALKEAILGVVNINTSSAERLNVFDRVPSFSNNEPNLWGWG